MHSFGFKHSQSGKDTAIITFYNKKSDFQQINPHHFSVIWKKRKDSIYLYCIRSVSSHLDL